MFGLKVTSDNFNSIFYFNSLLFRLNYIFNSAFFIAKGTIQLGCPAIHLTFISKIFSFFSKNLIYH
jgi:hypothetical protein